MDPSPNPAQDNPESATRRQQTLAIETVRQTLEAVAVEADIEPMGAYMKGKFAFLGVRAPAIRAATKETLKAGRTATASELIEFGRQCWAQPEREFQYLGALMLRKWASKLDADHIGEVEQFIITKSWWDTVDSLAAWTVGPMVTNFGELKPTMDQWIESDNIWLARTAILHQLGYKEATDAEVLFRYCDRRAEDTEFFIRKAVGWALRQYARQDPEAVRAFVSQHDQRLSGLSKREALKHIGRDD